MKNLIFQRQWNWMISGVALGFVFLAAVAFVKPIGVSTQFVILDGIAWHAVSDGIVTADAGAKHGFSSPNAYLNKSGGKYAGHVAHPMNYSFIFVLAMAVGGLLAAKLTVGGTKREDPTMPSVWRERFGGSGATRHLAAFAGGFLVLVGARLAGGCTSGHMMSGMMQTSLSGYLFALGAFVAAVPTAIILFRKAGK